jgi:hypothetical protein
MSSGLWWAGTSQRYHASAAFGSWAIPTLSLMSSFQLFSFSKFLGSIKVSYRLRPTMGCSGPPSWSRLLPLAKAAPTQPAAKPRRWAA